MIKHLSILSDKDTRKFLRKIVIVFLSGVVAVLVIVFIANRQVQKYAQVNAELEQLLVVCGKQLTLAQYLSKNALLLDDSLGNGQSQAILHLDSALSKFHDYHLSIRRSNNFLRSHHLPIDSLVTTYEEMSPYVSSLIKSSYGIQESNRIAFLQGIIIENEQRVTPLLNKLSDQYQRLAGNVNTRLSNIISLQYWFVGLSVSLGAGIVLFFVIQLIRSRVRSYKNYFADVLESKKRYEGLITKTQDVVYQMKGDGTFIYINPAFEKLFDATPEELNQKKWYDYVAPEYKKEVIDFYDRAVQGGSRSCSYEFPIITNKGDEKWIAQSTTYSYDEKGRVTNIYNIARDITEVKQDALKEEKYQQGLRLLSELSSKSELSIQKLLEYGLKVCLDYLGLEIGIVSKIWMDEYLIVSCYPQSSALHPKQKFKLGDTYCDITVAKKGRVLSIDHMSKSEHKDHPCFKRFELESYIGAAYRVEGKVGGTVSFTSSQPRKQPFSNYELDFINLLAKWVGSLMEQEENQSKIQEEQNLLKTFISSAPAAIAMFDKHMHYISASERWYKDQNIEGDIIGKSHYKVFPEIPKIWKEMHRRALQGEIIKPGIEKFVRADGTIQWLQGEIHPWLTHKGKIGGIIIFINDLTDMKRQEAELRRAKKEAEEAGKTKEQFLSTMSHEIRTPLNAIIGTTNLLELEHPELAGNNRLRMLKFGSNNLLTLINDILDFQKIESGNLEIVEDNVNLHLLIDDIIEAWEAASQLSNVKLISNYSQELSENYLCDQVRLTQILNNLISNALKFTTEGKVELQVTQHKEKGIQFAVSDTGIGIAPDQLDLIFDAFKQINNQHTLKEGGTGLGLAICKRLVELMGGELQVTSDVGKGTTFFFQLPLKTAISNASDRMQVSRIKEVNLNIQVLLVEDNLANQEIARSFLERWGVHVDIANNGKESLEKVINQSYDLILMDMRMPVMNGYEAAKSIRSMKDSYFQQIPIIALTASTMGESKEKMMNCGVNDFVMKPFDPKDLLEKISMYSSSKKDSPNQAGTQESKNGEGSKLIRFKFLHEALAGNKEEIQMIADMAHKSILEDIVAVRKKMEEQNRDEAYDHLHKMKSNLANLDLKRLWDSMPDYTSEHFWNDLPGFLTEVEQAMTDIEKYLTKMQ